jgi:hypothetical protein
MVTRRVIDLFSGTGCHTSNGDDDGTSAIASMPSDGLERSAVPRELSEAILDAVEAAYRDPPPTQARLGVDQ